MNDACRAFREEWLRYEGSESAHASLCGECTEWVHRTERLVRVLRGLGRRTAPPELDQRVERELAGDRSLRLERVLGSLTRLGAPAALDERVAALLGEAAPQGDEERGERKAQALRALDVHQAPGVLDRLLDEELRAPERQRTERFSGSLERLRAPRALEERLGSFVRRKAVLRLVVGPLVTLAAAGLVVWLSTRQSEPRPLEYRFQVIQASSLEDIDPWARGLAQALGGGGGVR